jgi:hypothetical protein
MPENLPSLDYVLLREDCVFTFPEGAEDESVSFDAAPTHIRFLFQGQSFTQFVCACIRLLRKQMVEAQQRDPDRYARLEQVGEAVLNEWNGAGPTVRL